MSTFTNSLLKTKRFNGRNNSNLDFCDATETTTDISAEFCLGMLQRERRTIVFFPEIVVSLI